MQPRLVILFSGHMIDAPGRQPPRFSADKESTAAQKIAEALDQLGAGPHDLALTQGACGGDLLFSDACQQRSVQVQWLQPFSEAEFIERSVVACGESWVARYRATKAKLANPIQCLPQNPADAPPQEAAPNPYERCNLWLLQRALSYGADKLRFICLWNGSAGDGPGGADHMYNQLKHLTGQTIWIDTRQL